MFFAPVHLLVCRSITQKLPKEWYLVKERTHSFSLGFASLNFNFLNFFTNSPENNTWILKKRNQAFLGDSSLSACCLVWLDGLFDLGCGIII